ncbi:short-chain dehydrogenase/reductase SDR [Neocallimastix lanati (nom. inval.)]|jgi:short-subunit dehydrogenase|uniref:Short-chain dehydrogenase/reductase SDR n=1 Tax=Neocallimastix californiae TaxID=1754190 RepID=A0A1Y2D5L4_9FUNG|nr:short-chain dehydrogenase/reductase SDR [Neocallimastix sp. JGI-2020a]ORY54497.1 short-chain dehydrogenase/reductase SDR [Neocallimastix californiae]|eukprot:ORY54497.1 short-chain dehydrogenase/reductase SDR [Neocallimastix californiae]
MKTAVIVGAGKGMGNHIAERFAKEGFRVVLMARRQEAVEAYVQEFKGKGYEAVGKVADASDKAQITSALQDIQKQFDFIDVLVYNVAILEGGKASELTSESVLKHFNVDVAGGVSCVEVVLPEMRKRKTGAILFTGGLFGVFPNAYPDFANISIGKEVLRIYAMMLNKELKDTGVFVGIVNLMGVVGSNESLSPKNLSDYYWKLYTEQKDFEIMAPSPSS